jgi:plasmid rolling circle replication initiator protein Rep
MTNDITDLQKKQELFKKFNQLKNKSKSMSTSVLDAKKQKRMSGCATYLFFERWQNKFNLDDIKKRITKSYLCEIRLCDFCNFLKARKIGHQLKNVMLNLHAEGYQFSMITLSAKNCDIDSLDKEIKYLNKSWNKLRQKKFFKPFEYWFKALEFTYNKQENSFNPHFHIILAYIPTGYFHTANYVSQDQFLREWQHSLQCDYPPTARIQTIKPNKEKGKVSLISAIAEVSKYPFKTMEFKSLSDEVLNDVIFRQLKNVRFFTTSRNIKISENITEEDYINQETYRLLDIEIYKHFSNNYNKIKVVKNEEI